MSGSALTPTRYLNQRHFDSLSNEIKVSEIVDAQGEWSALASKSEDGKNHFLYFGDSSGFAPLFYSLVPGRAVVFSESFSGVVHGVKKLGGSLTLNLPNYLTLMGGKSATFQNLIANQTMANEIHILSYDTALYVGPEITMKIDRDELSGTAQIDDYQSALDIGIESTSESIKTFLASNEDHNPIITLTGGVDSRVALALLSTTGMAQKFSVWSMDPRNAKRAQQKRVLTADVELARELRLKSGIEWMAPRRRAKLSLSFDEALTHYQSYNSNYSFGFTPANHMTIDAQPILTLRGGAGEVLRGTGGARLISNRYAEYCKSYGAIPQAEWVAKHYSNQSLVTEATLPVIENNLTTILADYSNTSMRERIDGYYRDTRNRGHFGHLRQSDSVNDRLMQVLTNPYLVRAAQLADYDFKTEGRVVADLFDKIDPAFRGIPFETAAANSQLFQGNPDNFRYQERDGWEREFDRLSKQALPTQFQHLHHPGDRNEDWDFSPRLRSITFIENGFKDILDAATRETGNLLLPLHQLILQHVRANKIPLGSLVAKIASTLELFRPIPLSKAGTHLYCDPSRSDLIAPSSVLTAASVGFMGLK